MAHYRINKFKGLDKDSEEFKAYHEEYHSINITDFLYKHQVTWLTANRYFWPKKVNRSHPKIEVVREKKFAPEEYQNFNYYDTTWFIIVN